MDFKKATKSLLVLSCTRKESGEITAEIEQCDKTESSAQLHLASTAVLDVELDSSLTHEQTLLRSGVCGKILVFDVGWVELWFPCLELLVFIQLFRQPAPLHGGEPVENKSYSS